LDLAAQGTVLGAQALVGLGERARQLRVLARERVGLERALHVEAHLVGLPRLLDVAVDAALVDRARERADVGVAREEDADRARAALDGALQELDARHARHHLVCDHQRHVLALEDGEPLLAAGGGEDAVVGAEGELERLEDRDLVVDDEDPVGVTAARLARGLDRPSLGFLTHDEMLAGHPAAPDAVARGRAEAAGPHAAPPPAHATGARPLPAGAPPDRAPRPRAPRRAPGRPSARRLAGRAASRRAPARAGRALHLHLADVALLVDVVEPAVLALHAAARDLLLALDRAPAPSVHARAADVSPLVEEVEPSLLPADAGLRHDVGHAAFLLLLGFLPLGDQAAGVEVGGGPARLLGGGEPHAPTGG